MSLPYTSEPRPKLESKVEYGPYWNLFSGFEETRNRRSKSFVPITIKDGESDTPNFYRHFGNCVSSLKYLLLSTTTHREWYTARDSL